MEWTASVPVAATTHDSAPEPPNDPKHSNDDNGDVPMRETTEETKKWSNHLHSTAKSKARTRTRMCTGERMSFTKRRTAKTRTKQQGTTRDAARDGLGTESDNE